MTRKYPGAGKVLIMSPAERFATLQAYQERLRSLEAGTLTTAGQEQHEAIKDLIQRLGYTEAEIVHEAMPARRWRHTRRLNVGDRGPHEPEPYARVSDDGANRCSTCGDYVVEAEVGFDAPAGAGHEVEAERG